jgi:23S rRNA (uracil1939-C5)-methyltransferase
MLPVRAGHAAPCPYFGACGGCALQDRPYPEQLALKRGRIEQAFSSLGYGEPVELIGLDDPWRYRNKAELAFGTQGGALTLGFHARGSFWRVVDAADCLLLPESMVRLAREVHALAGATDLPAYDTRTHRGFWRHLILRHSRTTGQLLACIVTAPGDQAPVERLAERLLARGSPLAGLSWGVSERLSDVAVPEALAASWGATRVDEQIGPFRCALEVFTFLQPSVRQAERLYAAVCEALDSQVRVAWDVYSGAGLIAYHLARQAREVYGIESDPGQVALARENARRNHLPPITWSAGPAETILRERRFWLGPARPDAVVVDPPRAGLHPSVLSTVLAARPRTIAYVSCNLQTLVRDLRVFGASYPRYRLERVRAFDMCPQTWHAEFLAVLRRV